MPHPHGPYAQMIFRLGGVQYDWAHPQLEEAVARHGVLPNQQMKPASVKQDGLIPPQPRSSTPKPVDFVTRLYHVTVKRGATDSFSCMKRRLSIQFRRCQPRDVKIDRRGSAVFEKPRHRQAGPGENPQQKPRALYSGGSAHG